MAQPKMFEENLPADVQEKLKRLEELESKNAELLKDNVDLKNKVEARGSQPFTTEAVELGDNEFRYTVDLPPSGGMHLAINGTQYWHGQTYTVDRPTLQTIMEMVYRSWKHEDSLHNQNENAYRPQVNATFSMRSGARIR